MRSSAIPPSPHPGLKLDFSHAGRPVSSEQLALLTIPNPDPAPTPSGFTHTPSPPPTADCEWDYTDWGPCSQICIPTTNLGTRQTHGRSGHKWSIVGSLPPPLGLQERTAVAEKTCGGHPARNEKGEITHPLCAAMRCGPDHKDAVLTQACGRELCCGEDNELQNNDLCEEPLKTETIDGVVWEWGDDGLNYGQDGRRCATGTDTIDCNKTQLRRRAT
jgi:hypothetical protein